MSGAEHGSSDRFGTEHGPEPGQGTGSCFEVTPLLRLKQRELLSIGRNPLELELDRFDGRG